MEHTLHAFSHFFILSSTVHKTLQDKNTSQTHFEISCDKVSGNDRCSLSRSDVLVSACTRWPRADVSPQGNGHLQDGDRHRHASLSEEEENLAVLRRSGTSHPLESNYTPDGLRLCFLRHLPSFISTHSISSALCPQTRHERAAGNRESLRGGAALRPPGRHEHELFCPWLSPSTDSAGCVVRDTPLRWTTRPCFPSCLLLCRTKRRFYLETCLKSTTSTRGERVPPICLTGWLLHHQLLIIKPLQS